MDPAAIAAVLDATLSPDASMRTAAEGQLRAFEAGVPGFAAALLALARSPAAPPGTRQSAAVMLKGLVLRRWSPDDERHFVGPELPDPEKAALKADLLEAVAEPDSKLRTAVGMVISAIYASDEWPELLPALCGAVGSHGGGGVGAPPPAAVAGAVRALALIVDDVSDEAALAAAPALLPAMRSLAADAAAGPALRAQALGVGAALLGALAVCGGAGSAARRAADPEVGPWLAVAAGILSSVYGGAAGGGWALRCGALRLATRVAAGFGRAAAPSAPALTAAVWAALTAALPAYVRACVGGGTPLDADGCGGTDSEGEEGEEEEAVGVSSEDGPATAGSFVGAALEFFCMAAAARPGLPPSTLPDLLNACLVSMRAPRAGRAAWAADADAFVCDEDEDAAGPRGAGEVLLATLVLGDDDDGFGGAPRVPPSPAALAALAGAVVTALGEADASRAAGAAGWWLPREAALLAVGACRDALIPGPAAPAGAPPAVPGALEPVALMRAVLAVDLASPPAGSEAAAAAAGGAPPPLLAARALWLAARLAPGLDPQTAGACLAAAAAAASPASPPPVQVQACRAVAALVPLVLGGGGGAVAVPATPAAAAAAAAAGGVVAILTAGTLTDRAAALALEALTALAVAGAAGGGPGGPTAAAGAALRAWAAAAADPLVGPAAEDAVLALAASPSCRDATLAAALPALADVVRAPSAHGGTAVTAALGLLAGLVSRAPPEAAAAAHASVTPPALAIIAARGGGDPAAARAACDFVRALVRAGGPGLLAAPGVLAALAAPLVRLVGPLPPGADPGEAADAAGRAVPALTSLLLRAPADRAPAALQEAAAAAAARLASGATPPTLGAALAGLVGRAVAADPACAIACLAAAPPPPDAPPLPPGVPPPVDPATTGLLAPALVAWFARAGEVVGAAEICASTAGLGALALAPPHPALDTLLVPGAPVVDAGGSGAIRTRARARAAGPQAWTALPARAKALALLADAVLEEAEGRGGGGGAGDSDGGWESASDEEGAGTSNDENEGPSPGGRSSVAAALARGDGAGAFAARLGCLGGGGWGGSEADSSSEGGGGSDADPADPLVAARAGDLAAADLRRAAGLDLASLRAAAGLLSEAQQRAVEAAVRAGG